MLDGQTTVLADEELEPVELRHLRRHVEAMDAEMIGLRESYDRLEAKFDFFIDQCLPRAYHQADYDEMPKGV